PLSPSATGVYPVALSNVAATCTVSGSNPRTVTVPAGGTGSTTFSVSCTTPPTTGNLTVSNSTTGTGAPSSYTVTVDAGTRNATSHDSTPDRRGTVQGLAAGSHSVTLTVASNCTVTNTNPQTVTVSAGSTASASFTVSCTTPPTTGNLTVTTSTTGSSFPSGYTVTVDGSQSQAIGVNSNVTFTSLSAGSTKIGRATRREDETVT